MRPRGCQETAAAEAARIARCNLHISNQFEPPIFLTLLKTRTYTHGVTTRVSLAALLLVAAALLSPATPHAQAIPRSMYVSALDEAGAPVADLGPSDFLVREDKAPREVLRVAAADEPMQLAILVDNSQAARNYIADIRTGLEGFVDRDDERHQERAVDHRARRAADGPREPVDRSRPDHEGRLPDLRAAPERQLPARRPHRGQQGIREARSARPVIVVITTEGPEFSSRRYEDVLKPLHEVGAALHVLVLGPPSNSIDEDARNRSAVLDEGPRTTGGRREIAPGQLRAAGRVEEARHRAEAAVSRHLRAAADAHSARKRHRQRHASGTDRARHAHPGEAGAAPAVMHHSRACSRRDAAGRDRGLVRRHRRLAVAGRSANGGAEAGRNRRVRPGRAGGRRAAAGSRLPGRRRPRVAQRHGGRRQRALRDRPGAGGLQRFRRRREAGRHLLQQDQPADRPRR